MDPVGLRRHRHDPHLQLSIRLHPIHSRDETHLPRSSLRENSGHLLGLHSVRNLAHARVRVFCRQIRHPQTYDLRCVLHRARMGAGRDRRQVSHGTLHLLRRDCRNRSWNHLHFLRRQCLEVVSRSPRLGCRANRRRIRWRRSSHHHAHRQNHSQHRLGACHGILGPRPGNHRRRRRHDPSSSSFRMGSGRMGPACQTGK